MKRIKLVALAILSAVLTPLTAADWLTDGGDTRRNNWQKDEKILTKTNVKDMKLLWKTKLDNQPRQMHSLLEPLVIGRVNTKSGPKEMVIQAGVSDNVYAIDAKTGELLWKQHFESAYKEPPGARTQVLCPGGMTANVTVGSGRGAGQVHRLRGVLGRQSAPAERGGRRGDRSIAFEVHAAQRQAVRAEPGQQRDLHALGAGLRRQSEHGVHLRSGDQEGGQLGSGGRRDVGTLGTGDQQGSVMYTGTGDGRWDPENGLYGNGIIGVKQDPKTKALELVDYYGPSNAEWLVKRDLDMQVTPAIFDYKGKEYMIDASKECRIYLMDTESIGGDDHRTPVYRTPLICNEMVNFAEAGIWGSLATWEEGDGTRWVLTPFWGPKHSKFKAPIENGEVKNGAIAAFKVETEAARCN